MTTTGGIRLNSDAQDLVATVEGVFAAVGKDDRAGLAELLCEDFHAFENGVHMTGRELLDLMGRSYAEGKRYQWSVNAPQVEQQGDLGVVVYVNHGSIADTPGADPVPVSWLETAVLRRHRSGWRLAFVHSTRTRETQASA